MTKRRIDKLYPRVQPLVYSVLTKFEQTTGRTLNVVQGLRSFDEQFDLFSQGRVLTSTGWLVVDRSKIVTNAKPGMSWHCYGLAWDVAFSGEDPYLKNLRESDQLLLWNTYGKIGKNFGMTWGGDFKLANGTRDLPHLELPCGLSLEQALAIYSSGGLQAVWNRIEQIRKGLMREQD